MYDKQKNLKIIAHTLSARTKEIKSENREPDADERAWANRLFDLEDRIEKGEEIDMTKMTKPVTQPIKPDPNYEGHNRADIRNQRPYTLKGPNDDKSYRSLFGDGLGYHWKDKRTGFFAAATSGLHHPDLETRAMIEGVGSDGGFWVPEEWSTKIHQVSLENEIVMPGAYVQPMRFDEFRLPAYEIGDHSSNLMGGMIFYYRGETNTLTEANPKAREIHLKTKKLTGLIRMSHELLDDKLEGGDGLVDVMGRGLGWARDRAFIKGSGSGEPLGILNAPCLLSQAKDAGQSADTITYSNLSGMLSKLFPGSFNNSIWICHVTTIQQLLQLGVPVGVGGGPYPALNESNGKFTLLSRPVVFTEKTEPLGDKGDIILADLSQYVIGLRIGMRFAMDESKYFTSDEVVAKLIERHDGEPLWNQAVTLEDGSSQVSPFVTLDERA